MENYEFGFGFICEREVAIPMYYHYMAQEFEKYMKPKAAVLFTANLFLLLLPTSTTATANIIKTLPGYPDTLPFKLETGLLFRFSTVLQYCIFTSYPCWFTSSSCFFFFWEWIRIRYIGVGENEEVQLFYYFIESERNPDKDPLLFWLAGGPGCSGFSSLAYEIGPLAFDFSSFNGSLPCLVLNPYSWTKMASIIFIDSPVGTGFSYLNTSRVYTSSDTKSATEIYTFLRKWLLNHPEFIKNRFYVGGVSYGGKITAMVTLKIAQGNEAGLEPRIALQGYLVGNSITDVNSDMNERIPYAHRMALISDQYFELTKSSCKGEYVNPDPNNFQCLEALQLIKKCTNKINGDHILEPTCKNSSLKWGRREMIVEDDPDDFLFMYKQEEPWCRGYNHATSYFWANDQNVQEALHIRKGSIKEWKRCKDVVSYDCDVQSVVDYHQVLSEKGFQALIYSGDHDMLVPYMRTLNWIHHLNLTTDDDWRPWTVDGQIAGYTEKYKNNEAYLTFATVKGAGHTAPEYKPKQCFAMVDRWFSLFPL